MGTGRAGRTAKSLNCHHHQSNRHLRLMASGQDLFQICVGSDCVLLGIGKERESLLPIRRPVQIQVISSFKQ